MLASHGVPPRTPLHPLLHCALALPRPQAMELAERLPADKKAKIQMDVLNGLGCNRCGAGVFFEEHAQLSRHVPHTHQLAYPSGYGEGLLIPCALHAQVRILPSTIIYMCTLLCINLQLVNTNCIFLASMEASGGRVGAFFLRKTSA